MRRLLTLLLVPLFALGLSMAPAAAADITSFTVDGAGTASVYSGDTVELAWEATVVGDQVEASTTGPDTALFDGTYPATGTESIVINDPGTYTFTITATDGTTDTESVTVTVAAPTEITPAPVTFPDSCTVVIPASTGANAGTEYGYGTGAMGGQLAAGTYELAELGANLTFMIFPTAGYVFPAGTDTTINVTTPASCFGTSDETPAAPAVETPTVAPAAGIIGNQGNPVGA